MFGAQRPKRCHLNQITKRQAVIWINWSDYYRLKAALAGLPRIVATQHPRSHGWRGNLQVMGRLGDGVGGGKARIEFRHGFCTLALKMSNCSCLVRIHHPESRQKAKKHSPTRLKPDFRSETDELILKTQTFAPKIGIRYLVQTLVPQFECQTRCRRWPQ